MDAATVARRLGLGDAHRDWLTELADHAQAAPPLQPIPTGALAATLTRLGCAPDTVADAVATLPEPGRDPERWWLLDHAHRRLVATAGDVDAQLARWPALPDALGLAGRCFGLHWFAATVPSARAVHHERGVPDAVSWATLSDLGRHALIHRTMTGETGVDAAWWMTLHVRGLLLQVGALQYEPIRIGPGGPDPWHPRSDVPGLRAGDPSVAIHIPTGASLDAASRRASMRAGAALLDAAYPVATPRVLTCSSWLLDDQLAGMLGPDSRIVGFGREFTLVPGWRDADGSVLMFAFDERGEDRGAATTRLQRAVRDHLARGGHFRWRSGWRSWPAQAQATATT